MKLFQSETLEVSIDSGFNRLLLQCHGEVSLEHCQEGFLLALQSAREHEIKSWLLDLRQMDNMPEQVDSWIQDHFFPLIMEHLGMNNHLAILVSEQRYAYLLGAFGKAGMKSYNCFIIINVFSEHTAAAGWLEDNIPAYI